jgi:DNA-directed RNA polymerase specialized sigma24 family protein
LTGTTLDIEEVRKAVSSLTNADLLRLERVARIYEFGVRLEGMDLVNEAISRTLSGTRTCPRDVPFVVFLKNVMRSIAWSERTRIREEPMLEVITVGLGDGSAVLDYPSDDRNAEDSLIARQDAQARLRALEEVFANDEDAQLVLMGDLDEMSAAEMRSMTGWSEQDLATVRRRIRRKLSNAYPSGWVQ